MPNDTNSLAQSAEKARIAAIQAKVDAVLADPARKAVADRIRPLGQGSLGAMVARLILEGVPKDVITSGYAAARAVEFATRPKYRAKDAVRVWSDVNRHAANHHQQAIATIQREGLGNLIPANAVGKGRASDLASLVADFSTKKVG
jgi:hypothetical protein